MTTAANDHALGPGEKISYNVKEAALALGLSAATVWLMIKERQVVAKKVRGRTVVPRTELERVLQEAPEARAA